MSISKDKELNMKTKLANKTIIRIITMSLGLFFCWLSFFKPPAALAVEGIKYLYINAQINRDGSVDITQNYNFSFDPQNYEGFVSSLPLVQQNENIKNKVNISRISLTDKNRENIKFKTKKSNGNIIVVASSKQASTSELILSYRMENAIKGREGKDVFIFNPIRANWPFPIGQAIITVKLPDNLEEKDMIADCQVARTNGKKDCLSKRYLFNAMNKVDGAVLIAEDVRELDTFQIEVSIPDNIIQKQFLGKKAIIWLSINGIWVVVGLLTWVAMRAPKRKWHSKLWWWKYIKKRWLKF